MSTKSQKLVKCKNKIYQKITKQTWKLTIQFDEDFIFTPGQFITLKVRGVQRNYSIASFSKNKNLIELIIVKVENGKLTTILFSDVEPGENIEIKGPKGNFVMPENTNRDIFFICTGTGLAPFKSILDEIELSGKYPKRIFLILEPELKMIYFFMTK